jgi:hypothetical protein
MQPFPTHDTQASKEALLKLLEVYTANGQKSRKVLKIFGAGKPEMHAGFSFEHGQSGTFGRQPMPAE